MSSKTRLQQRLRDKALTSIEATALERDNQERLRSINDSPEAILGWAVYDLYDRIDQTNRQRLIGRLVGHSLLGKMFRSKFNPSPPLNRRTAYPDFLLSGRIEGSVIELPFAPDEYEDDQTLRHSWSLEYFNGYRAANTIDLSIFIKTTEVATDESEKDRILRVCTYYHDAAHVTETHGKSPAEIVSLVPGGIIGGSFVYSYTDGILDDPLVTVGKDAYTQVLGLIQQAQTKIFE